ncbi:hypothetical protein [Shewanella hafniensis]|uniref:hypothetical protein n=1 Tax=Shewanella hafniensis TaxID=365590 RepID=UPI00200DAB4E|nr:hypothetical protein [Shewanella hafniensis]MCL1133020.1 hypothetical protein [Shewanella hafniensis]
MWIVFLLVIILFILMNKIFALRLNSKGISPINIFFYVNVFIFSFFGVFFIYYFKDSIAQLPGNGIVSRLSLDNITLITSFYLYSLVVLLLLIPWCAQPYAKVDLYGRIKSGVVYSEYSCLPLVSIQILMALISFLYIGVENLPLYVAFNDGFIQASIVKASLMKGELDYNIPFFHNLFKIYIITLPLVLTSARAYNRKSVTYTVCVISCLVTMIYLIADLQKAPAVLFAIAIFFVRLHILGSSWRSFVIISILVLLSMLLYLLPYIVGDNMDLFSGVLAFINRAFVAQVTGMYFIVALIKPDINYILYNFPFAGRFFDLPPKADAIVMTELFGYKESNVNMNSYFLGEAYSSMGIWGLLISPFVVLFTLAISFLFYSWLTQKNAFIGFSLCLVGILFYMPINQSFNSFLWMKDFLLLFVYSLMVYFILSTFSRVKMK